MKTAHTKKNRVMTIIVDAEDESIVTILADNLGGNVTFHKDQIDFLKRVLTNLQEYSREMEKNYHNMEGFF